MQDFLWTALEVVVIAACIALTFALQALRDLKEQHRDLQRRYYDLVTHLQQPRDSRDEPFLPLS